MNILQHWLLTGCITARRAMEHLTGVVKLLNVKDRKVKIVVGIFSSLGGWKETVDSFGKASSYVYSLPAKAQRLFFSHSIHVLHLKWVLM